MTAAEEALGQTEDVADVVQLVLAARGGVNEKNLRSGR